MESMENMEVGRCIFLFSMLSMVKKSFFLIPSLEPGNEGCKLLASLALSGTHLSGYYPDISLY